MNADDDKHSAPIPIASCGPSHHVRSFSLSFASPNPPSLSASSLSSYSPTSPSPILAQTLPSFFSTSPNTAAANGLAASMSPSSGRPICGFASGKDWASAAAWAGGSAVEEEDEVEESSGVRIVAPAGSGSSLGVMGWQGKAMAPKAPAPPVVSGGSAGKSVGMATEKGAGLMRRLSLGGGGLFRPNVQRTSPPPPVSVSIPMTTSKSGVGSGGLPSSSSSGIETAQPTGTQGRPRKTSVGGKPGKRSISPTGERLLRGGGGGGGFF